MQIFPGEKSSISCSGFFGGNNTVVFPISNNHFFPKFASSVAHQGGKPWAWAESFAAYGTALTLETMKWISDFLFVRGINKITISLINSSVDGPSIAIERPQFCAQNPLFPYLHVYYRYLARLAYLLSLGHSDISTALYLPIRDIWAGGAAGDQAAANTDAFAFPLLDCQWDYDIIDDDLLCESASTVSGGVLSAGPMRYRYICIPDNRHMEEASKTKLEAFAASGGTIIRSPDALQKTDAAAGAFSGGRTISCEPPNKDLRVCKRLLENGRLYFVSYEGLNSDHCRVYFNETAPIYELDLEQDEIRAFTPDNAEYNEGRWSCEIDLHIAFSRVYLFTSDPSFTDPALSAPKPVSGAGVVNFQTLESAWTCRKIRQFKINDTIHRNDPVPAEFGGKKPVDLGNWENTLGADFSGEAEYETVFSLDAAAAGKALLLDLGEVKGTAAVILNGIRVGSRIWSPYRFDISGAVKAGDNRLQVSVVNTMANEFTHTKKFDQWSASQLGPYHQQNLAMERLYTASGIYGPVRLGYNG